ncbi:MAG: alanine dehydrogenase [Desulfoprunum sp.]|jgi:alanine dehydrogenase|uniref:alanine dehydrogenase n=1 Tax=Desulfoprunum sp. TaxID=2020866 RepID=UPI00052DD60C|nr:alanine dehydrogenase [Desulfobulbus sp. Tol-SR]
MNIGILKEIKTAENRVCMTPAGVEIMTQHQHQVLVETGAGIGSGFADSEYRQAGATLVETAAEIYAAADMVMHVKEPQPGEYPLIKKDQIIFTYLHLAADEQLTRALIAAGSVNIAYETIQKKDRSLPLLTPMSEVAGRMAAQEGANYLQMSEGGRGILLGGVPGVEPGNVVVIGCGVVGLNAARIACGLGARVYMLDTNLDRLRYLSEIMPSNCSTVMSTRPKLRELLREADLVIGSVLIPGAKAPKVITREMLREMKPGSVMVDVAIDQGGCFETSRPTTHTEPTFIVDGIIHYCVANMPGAVALTSTLALTNATLPYALQIANKGWKRACRDNEEIRLGVNVIGGRVTFKGVAEAFGMDHTPIESFLN